MLYIRAIEENLRERLLPEVFTTSDLQRWLRAEKYDVGKAESRLRHHLHWRADYLPCGRVLEVGSLLLLAWETLVRACFAAGVYLHCSRALEVIFYNHSLQVRTRVLPSCL